VLLIEEEADALKDGLGVGGEDGVLAHGDERLSLSSAVLVRLKLPAEHQVARRPRAAAEERVAGRSEL
jgi:hypothetical protein